MPEPVVIATSIFSGFNSFVKAISLAAHYKEVPNEVRQLHTNIERAESSINIARRLLRSKAHYLDPRLIRETEESIEKTNNTLLLVRDSIEACRKDLEIRQTVTPKNRVIWLLWKNEEFLSQLQTLGNCLGALDRDIGRLEMAHPPIVFVNGNLWPPAYADNDCKATTFGVEADGKEEKKPPFPRSPTKRIRSTSRSNNSSQVNLPLGKRTHKRHGSSRNLSPQFADGDEGYESDELSLPPRTADDQTSRDATEDLTLFANTTIGIGINNDTPGVGLGLSISEGQLSVRQIDFLQQAGPAIAAAAATPRSRLGISELPGPSSELQGEQPESDLVVTQTQIPTWIPMQTPISIPTPTQTHTPISIPTRTITPTSIRTPNPYTFASKNPWRRLAVQQSTSTSTLNSSIATWPRSDPPNAADPDLDAASVVSTSTSTTAVEDADESDVTRDLDLDLNLLGLSVTAPAVPTRGGASGDAVLLPGPGLEVKKVKWRRKSGFI
ncbi:hypothetical protein A1O7_05623 [Cladophialophora yegresii CBS 114405]|uniref:Uncharacterized protein n=1 Tax=Cladophialophora yegresii CBS 114405 TaxID=1182544 RepID=W9VRL0_9EURO|nr:uncharacterized protein A1O7_05623 [Cladophialophora yegresii CBS 114405]EXJ58198.1 hypothetical protein A1O7_05623 [Cladophialophora yegresii CBS 114405]